ncbi:methyltransferase [Haloferula helveola]|uniref:Methyltransferase n=1 Tax=Haloferula helveola TaxID=490095 RepID=A0ABN6H4Z5_9BACT|nr:methyltransferase [Haloferula helveola]
MPDAVRELYSDRRYPALSHPDAHPGVLAATARISGVPSPPLPESCRILDIGCGSGHHLLPLAERFPESTFHGIDFSDTAIRTARRHADAAGLKNISFEHADLAEWDPGDSSFDYVLAHGMLSSVGDETKAALLKLIQQSLAPDGVACISYHTLPGWSLRQEVAAMVKALPELGSDASAILKTLAESARDGGTPYTAHLASICESMHAKGGELLAFDELAPVCDPLHFGQVIQWTGQQQLRYLGEATLPGNLPPGLDPGALAKLQPLASDPVRFQQTLDLLSGRTERTSLFCHASLALDTETTTSVVLHFSARLAIHPLPMKTVHGEILELFHAALTAAWPSTRPVTELMEECASRLGPRWDPARGAKTIADWLYQAARLGWVELRTDAIQADPKSTARPRLSPLNLEFARSRTALVDGFHRSCGFPDSHWQIAAALDGSRSVAEVTALARDHAPDLDVEPWLRHLASRGLLVD